MNHRAPGAFGRRHPIQRDLGGSNHLDVTLAPDNPSLASKNERLVRNPKLYP
jgi:hypothetical protein